VELSIGLVNDAAIHELNRSFRKKDKPTDVLAFPMLDVLPRRRAGRRSGRDAKGLELREVTGLLGDVIISIETAERQARENDRPLEEELTMLLAHGLLTSSAIDHLTDAEERAMTESHARAGSSGRRGQRGRRGRAKTTKSKRPGGAATDRARRQGPARSQAHPEKIGRGSFLLAGRYAAC
jgi:probable rRNA maturation factor